MDTHADAAAAYAAAEASGWTNDTIDAGRFSSTSGGTEGREINRGTAAFRVLTAGQRQVGYSTYCQCVVVAQEPFDDLAPELTRIVPVRVGAHDDQHLTWNYAQLDGALRSVDHMSVQDAVRVGASHTPGLPIKRWGGERRLDQIPARCSHCGSAEFVSARGEPPGRTGKRGRR